MLDLTEELKNQAIEELNSDFVLERTFWSGSFSYDNQIDRIDQGRIDASYTSHIKNKRGDIETSIRNNTTETCNLRTVMLIATACRKHALLRACATILIAKGKIDDSKLQQTLSEIAQIAAASNNLLVLKFIIEDVGLKEFRVPRITHKEPKFTLLDNVCFFHDERQSKKIKPFSAHKIKERKDIILFAIEHSESPIITGENFAYLIANFDKADKDELIEAYERKYKIFGKFKNLLEKFSTANTIDSSTKPPSTWGYFVLSQFAGIALSSSIIVPSYLGLMEPMSIMYSLMIAGGIMGIATSIFHHAKDRRSPLCCIVVFALNTCVIAVSSVLAFAVIVPEIVDTSLSVNIAEGLAIGVIGLVAILLNTGVKVLLDKGIFDTNKEI